MTDHVGDIKQDMICNYVSYFVNFHSYLHISIYISQNYNAFITPAYILCNGLGLEH
jgi:hypothetical protein